MANPLEPKQPDPIPEGPEQPVCDIVVRADWGTREVVSLIHRKISEAADGLEVDDLEDILDNMEVVLDCTVWKTDNDDSALPLTIIANPLVVGGCDGEHPGQCGNSCESHTIHYYLDLNLNASRVVGGRYVCVYDVRVTDVLPS